MASRFAWPKHNKDVQVPDCQLTWANHDARANELSRAIHIGRCGVVARESSRLQPGV